jgi:hypothetical protein
VDGAAVLAQHVQQQPEPAGGVVGALGQPPGGEQRQPGRPRRRRTTPLDQRERGLDLRLAGEVRAAHHAPADGA